MRTGVSVTPDLLGVEVVERSIWSGSVWGMTSAREVTGELLIVVPSVEESAPLVSTMGESTVSEYLC